MARNMNCNPTFPYCGEKQIIRMNLSYQIFDILFLTKETRSMIALKYYKIG